MAIKEFGGRRKGAYALKITGRLVQVYYFVECLLMKIVQWKTVDENAVDSVEEGWTDYRMHNFFPVLDYS